MTWPMGPAGALFMEAILLSTFCCVVLHELGHALAARAFGIGTRDITLYPIGGVARLESTGTRPVEEVCISLAGPAVNLGIALFLLPLVAGVFLLRLPVGEQTVLAGVGGPLSLVGSYLIALCAVNVGLLGFNLLPVFPMDGGRVLRALLALGLGMLRATEIAAGVGFVLAVGLALFGLWAKSLSLALVAAFVAVVGQMELRALRKREARRRMAAAPVVEVLPALEGFTGFVWDRDNKTWVRWVDGRPADVR
jgi:Zn-dependent protease